MKLVLDMNLSPSWVEVLAREGHEVDHWSAIGDGKAKDHIIMSWARQHRAVVITHDLDFGSILAVTRAEAPSVLQLRTADPSPAHLSNMLIHLLRQYHDELEKGALLSLDETRTRIRLLPLKQP